MTGTALIDEFSLLGGPLHRLGCRLGLVRRRTNTVLLGVALGGVFWLIGVLLAWAGGTLPALLSLEVIGAHVRLLVAIPLLFLCETTLDPQINIFVRYCVQSGIVPAGALPDLETEIARTTRWKDAWLPEAMILAVVLVLRVIAPQLPWGGATSRIDTNLAESLAGWWYGVFCLTLFRFLVLRWAWRLALWSRFLWRLSRMRLQLMAAHADGAGGLGTLENVQDRFFALILALSTTLSASLAEDIARGAIAVDTIYSSFGIILVVDVLLFVSPVFFFTFRMLACKRQGMYDYMRLAARYVTGFDRKWIAQDAAPGEPLLGTPDVQSMADLAFSVDVVRHMRLAPLSWRMLLAFAVAALLPMPPLLLFKYPLAELAAHVIRRLAGL